MKAVLAALIVLPLFCAKASFADSLSAEDHKRLFLSINTENLKGLLLEQNLPGDFLPIVEKNLRGLQASNLFVSAYANKAARVFRRYPIELSDQDLQDIRLEMLNWRDDLAYNGLFRLPLEEQRVSLRLYFKYLPELPPDMCAQLIMLEDYSSSIFTKSEEDILRLMSLKDAEQYYALSRKAIFAELSNVEPLPRLEGDEYFAALERADDLIAAHFLVSDNADALIRAAEYPEYATDQELCESSILAVEAVLNAAGPDRDLIFRAFVQE